MASVSKEWPSFLMSQMPCGSSRTRFMILLGGHRDDADLERLRWSPDKDIAEARYFWESGSLYMRQKSRRY